MQRQRISRKLIFAMLLTSIWAFPIMEPVHAAACTSPTQTRFTDTATSTNYFVDSFTDTTANCTWTIPEGVSAIDLIAVGGGGGAGFGACGGGGGAGRVIASNSSFGVTAGSSVTMNIGTGGTGGYTGAATTAWFMGSNGNATSISINGTTYSASGGGGGGGQATNAGLVGGSGGGGTACSSASGGAADTSTISGFTTFGYAGGTGAQGSSGGGGGGAGAVGKSSGAGGNGLTLWGGSFAGGGGGWSGGTGATAYGGGSALSGTGSKSAAGNPGTNGTGGGGGGGNDGGSGLILIRFRPVTNVNAITYSGTIYKGIFTSLTVTTNLPGKVRFYIDGKRISTCLSIQTTGASAPYLATCQFKSAVQSLHTLSAALTPSDTFYSTNSAPTTSVYIQKRANSR